MEGDTARIKELEAARDSLGLTDLLDPTLPLMTRRAAARSLANVASTEVVPRLASFLASDPDRGVRQSLAQALGRLADDRALPNLLAALKDSQLMVREVAATALARYNSPAAFDALTMALKQNQETQDWSVRRFAAESLGRLGDRRASAALVEALRDPHDLVRPAVATALGRLGDRTAVPALKRARHNTTHRPGAECAQCEAIEAALKVLETDRPGYEGDQGQG